ncbi:predicted protein [Postia placenta Mad-698-R]|uniref:Uncharacterized protein n=1 Tax=Postia placenta MAD-698-R-SB12 TaxID=670580 RepID=A0A1X6MPB3_9APHY|nr:hypothetical protein POSPLADRAFT_1154700 [Postia placenta MAD-698-R-SB12]EED79794.1 predicted protein [Postia placenta Mad-698-R]OSX58241.1 hypothetical protein POSPLADRAFT_1154700 [Postia placenta MAD-698-R-SB12]
MSDGIVLQPAFNEALGPALIGTIAALALVMSIIDAASIYAHAQSQIVRLLDTAAAVVNAMVRHTIEFDCVRQVTRPQIIWHYTIKTKTDIIRLVDVFSRLALRRSVANLRVIVHLTDRGTFRQSEYALAVGDFQLYGHTNLTAERFGQAPTIFIVQCANQVLAHRTYKWPLTIIMASMSLSSFGKGCCSVYMQEELTMGLEPIPIPTVLIPNIHQHSSSLLPRGIHSTHGTGYLTNVNSHLCGYLRNGDPALRSKTAKKTDRLIEKLSMYAMNREVLTTIVQIAQVVTYVAQKKNVLYWAIF